MSNSADKRSVSTDALETLGMIHFRAEHRDAIHLAVEPVEAGEDLVPSQYIRLVDGLTNKVAVASNFNASLGIADPFIPSSIIKKGQRFWLVVHPRRITSLRHVWTHPDFDDDDGAVQ